MRKEKQKIQTMRYFIDAAIQIIQSEGVHAVSIRKVADVAGYNSATLYNYFDNLNHLKALAALTFTLDYIHDLKAITEGVQCSWEINLKVWQCFYEHSFDKPEIFASIFIQAPFTNGQSYIEEFFWLYPEKLSTINETIRKMLLHDDIHGRTLFLLNCNVTEGHLNEGDVNEILEMTIFIYEGLMNQLQSGIAYDKETFVAKGLSYTRKILESFHVK